MKTTIEQHIKKYLGRKNWVSSTELDREIAKIANRKECTISRTARKLSEDDTGILEKKMDKVVYYRLKGAYRPKMEQIERLSDGSIRVYYKTL